MARIHTVTRAQRELTCEACHLPIPKGTAYKWVRLFHAAKKSRHLSCPTWKASELTQSSQLQALYAAVEGAEADINAWEAGDEDADALASILATAAEGVREASEGYAESAEAIESGFDHETEQSRELQEKAEELEAFADELESWSPSADQPEEAADAQEPKPDPKDYPDTDEGRDDFESATAEWEEAREAAEDDHAAELAAWREEIADEARSTLDSNPM